MQIASYICTGESESLCGPWRCEWGGSGGAKRRTDRPDDVRETDFTIVNGEGSRGRSHDRLPSASGSSKSCLDYIRQTSRSTGTIAYPSHLPSWTSATARIGGRYLLAVPGNTNATTGMVVRENHTRAAGRRRQRQHGGAWTLV